jgi:hypothetical protein
MQSKAATVKAYLAELPPDRRAAIEAVRNVILANLDRDYEEGMAYGAIGYYVPHRIYPAGYHCDPKQGLPFAGLGSQKNYMSLGLMCHYSHTGEDRWFRAAWARTGKKLDMGKCCIRFRKLEDLALDVIAEAIRRMPVKKYIEHYESSIRPDKKRGSAASAKSRASGATGRKRPSPARRKTTSRRA